MPSVILSACVLAVVTVAVHAGGIAVLLLGLMRLEAPPADEPLAHHADAAPHALVADPDPPGGDFDPESKQTYRHTKISRDLSLGVAG
jgi:hypothetical protein